jgi:hypothetical protein
MLGIRWTVGDVNPRGFDALRLSIWGAWRVFGPAARYRVYVNTIGVERARELTRNVPDVVEWLEARRDAPDWLGSALDAGLAEGVAWKFMPLRAFADAHELALDNDVILWGLPAALARWLEGETDFVLAEDVIACHGAFTDLCPARATNSGIRGLPPQFDLNACIRSLLARRPVLLAREVDEQGLQVAALHASGSVGLVPLEDVTICSPFPPHLPHLGRVGAHFVGLNTRRLGFEFDGRPAELVRAEHWDGHLRELCARVGSS